ncbi:hypothetical protein SCMU_13500 [Sinomonas cyclohexanicum]|uniref:Uncharacterized protein n=1 Tax=Sinomonas cyclohexanicum TaxID=322009 RepID=A0ABM7PTD5_SINCY|nr:hypothetical protein SCMU_13500 [Corynebacterium cyclohexanicum]
MVRVLGLVPGVAELGREGGLELEERGGELVRDGVHGGGLAVRGLGCAWMRLGWLGWIWLGVLVSVLGHVTSLAPPADT